MSKNSALADWCGEVGMPHVLKMENKGMVGEVLQSDKGAPSWMLENAKDLLGVRAKDCYR